MQSYHVAIIGSGPAGLTAGIYSARAGLNCCIIEGKSPGGQLMTTTVVENWPGYVSIMGPQLMMHMREQTQAAGCAFLEGNLTQLKNSSAPFTLALSTGDSIQTDTLIIATGAQPKRLGCPGEDKYWGKGVTPCTICDGALYKDQPVVIVGGGDTAMESAVFMSKLTNNITIVQIEPKLTASAAMQKKILNNKDITFLYNSTVAKITGNEDHITTIIVRNQKTNKEQELTTAALFVAIGLTPNSELFKGILSLTPTGCIELVEQTQTSIPGIFAAGDVTDIMYRQAVTAAGDGCKAAMDAQRFLNTKM